MEFARSADDNDSDEDNNGTPLVSDKGDINLESCMKLSSPIDDNEDDKGDGTHKELQYCTSQQLYRANRQNYINMLLNDHGKHSFLTKFSHGVINQVRLGELLKVVHRHGHKSDFAVIILIRLLYLHKGSKNPITEQVEKVLHNFSFWTGDCEKDSRRNAMKKTIFWSENHIFMYLSTAYLFHQHVHHSSSSSLVTVETREDHNSENTAVDVASSSATDADVVDTTGGDAGDDRTCVDSHDLDQLLIYLDSHCHPKFNGVYEVLSCTYLPWTICALLNLHDFADDSTVRDKARLLLDHIITLFCLVSTCDGICNLTASTRQYLDLRTRTWNHNINQLIFMITGKIHDPRGLKPSPLGDFLATSTYSPPDDILETYFNFSGSILKKKMNHLTKETREVYRAGRGEREVEEIELIPFYWSAGLIAHPKYVRESLSYIHKYHLSKNPGISALTYLPGSVAKPAMDTFDTLSKGQAYTSVFLNIFKSPSRSVVMTSFDHYNVGRHAYQQNTWMVNLNGVGIWSQSGVFLNLERINISNPAVTQKGNILLAVYYMHHTIILDNAINLFWPRQYFTAEYRQNISGGPFYETSPLTENHSSLLSKTSDAMSHVLRVLSGGKHREHDENPIGVGTKEGTWWIGCRLNMYVGVYCNQETEEDRSLRNDSQVQFFRDDPIHNIPRRRCNHRKVCWVVVVGDTMMYPTHEEFQNYCTQINIREHIDPKKKQYTIHLQSGGGGGPHHELPGPADPLNGDEDGIEMKEEGKGEGKGEEGEGGGDEDEEDAKMDDIRANWNEQRGSNMCRNGIEITVTIAAP